MRRIAYAVSEQSGSIYRFSIWHDTKESALLEAERLCGKERKTFIVLKLIAFCKIEEKPVKTTTFE